MMHVHIDAWYLDREDKKIKWSRAVFMETNQMNSGEVLRAVELNLTHVHR